MKQRRCTILSIGLDLYQMANLNVENMKGVYRVYYM